MNQESEKQNLNQNPGLLTLKPIWFLYSHETTHSSTLVWKIPWAEEPGRLQSMGSLRVGHDWATSLSLFTFMHWGRKWQPTPVFLLGESQGQGSLVGCHLWGCTESGTTEATWRQQQQQQKHSHERFMKRNLCCPFPCPKHRSTLISWTWWEAIWSCHLVVRHWGVHVWGEEWSQGL